VNNKQHKDSVPFNSIQFNGNTKAAQFDDFYNFGTISEYANVEQ